MIPSSLPGRYDVRSDVDGEVGMTKDKQQPEQISWAIEGADDDFAFEICRPDREEGRVLVVADLKALLVENELRGKMIERLIEVVEFAYMNASEQPREIAEARTLLGDS